MLKSFCTCFSLLSCTVYGVDFIAPGFWQVVFPEGAGNGTVDCFPVQIVDDDDFEERLEDFGVYIQSSSVSPESTLLVDPKFLTIRINDTEGGRFIA